MIRISIYILIIVLVFTAPVTRIDVGTLRPVEVVAIHQENGELILQTDTGDLGRGADVESALRDMKQKTPAVIYLDTAKYLLVDINVQHDAEALRGYLKSNVKVALFCDRIDLKYAGMYLDVQDDLMAFEDWKPGVLVTVLTSEKYF